MPILEEAPVEEKIIEEVIGKQIISETQEKSDGDAVQRMLDSNSQISDSNKEIRPPSGDSQKKSEQSKVLQQNEEESIYMQNYSLQNQTTQNKQEVTPEKFHSTLHSQQNISCCWESGCRSPQKHCCYENST